MISPENYFICCERCFESIALISPRAAKLWMDFCAYHLELGIVALDEKKLPEVELLESLGFLLTTDTDDLTLIRVEGEMKTEEGEPFFCKNNGLHR